jgi:hypothetical protein
MKIEWVKGKALGAMGEKQYNVHDFIDFIGLLKHVS